MFSVAQVLRAPVEGEGGGGLEAADKPAESPKFVTAKELNAAVADHVRRVLKPMQEAFEQRIAALEAALGDKPEEASQEDDPAASWERDKKAYEQQLAEKDGQIAAEKSAREVSAAKVAREEERKRVLSFFSSKGITGARANAAVAYLYEQGKVRRSEQGAIVFVGDDGEVELEAGLAAWLASDEGKEFLPARAAKGSGETAPRAMTKPQAPPRPQKGAALMAAFMGGSVPVK